ncbi:hypothetical protein D521_0459 [beta proteobacterium CB]|nr:hypothetical protein D521_0459 [beta proteobacterium CB]
MRSTLLTTITLMLLITLTGCEKLGSFGVSSDKSQSTSSDQSKSISQDQSINSSKSARSSVKIPASALIASTVSEYLSQEGFKAPYRPSFIKSSALTLSSHAKEPNAVYKGAALAMAASFEPALAWPSYTNDQNFMVVSTALSNFTNSVSTQIASNLKDSTLQDPSSAQAQIIGQLGAIPAATLESAWANALSNAKAAKMTQNLSGSSAPVEFKANDAVITAGAQGLSITQNGVTWFGNGNLSGRTYDLSMENSLSTSLSQKLDLNIRQSNGNSESTRVSADIKH